MGSKFHSKQYEEHEVYGEEEEEELVVEDQEEGEEETEQQNEDDNQTLKNEISQMSFEELLKIKDKLGTKVYNATIASKFDNNLSKNKNMKNQSFKRVNKNRPQEISSKKSTNQFREVFPVKKRNEDKERRDPRFDEQCGHFSQNIFDKTYSFLNNIKDKETNDLKKMLKKTKNDEKREELKYLLQRNKNQKIADQMKQKKREIESNIRNKLSEETETKKPFVNKSTLKKLELVDRFKQLKKSGKLKKYLEKKRKRNANRERKKIPKNKTID